MTPSAGLARHWKWHCNEIAARAGSKAWPTPDILPLNAWLERLWEQSLLSGGAAGRLTLLSPRQFGFAGERQLRDMSLQAIAGGSMVRQVIKGWQLCREWGITSRELDDAAGSIDERLFAEWAAGVESRSKEQRWADPWSAHRFIADDLAAGIIRLPGPVRFIGFQPVTPQLRRVVDVLERLDRFAGWGCAPVAVNAGTAVRIGCADDADERRQIVAWVCRLRESTPRALIAVVLPKLTQYATDLRRELLDGLAPDWRFDAQGAASVSGVGTERLADTGPVHTALLALRLPAGRLDYQDFGQLLRSPYLRGAAEEANARAMLDIQCRQHNVQQIDLRAIVTANEARGAAAVPQMMEILRTGLALHDQASKSRERQEPADWIGVIDPYLRAIGWCKGRTPGADERKTVAAWQSLLEQFATLNDFVGRIDYPHAVRLLATLAREQPVANGAGAAAVQILTVDDADSYQFDGLWCAGLTSEVWPPSPRSNSLVPMRLQRDRGIPEANPVHYHRLAAERLERLLAAAPHAIASWPQQADGSLLAMSPALEPVPEATGSEPAPDDDRSTKTSSDNHIEILQHDPAPPVDDPAAIRGGSRVLSLQSNCPARAFFEIRLGAKPLRIPPFGIDAAGRGHIVHDALEDLYRRLKAFGGPQRSSEAEIAGAVDAAATVAVDRQIPRAYPLSKALRRNEHERLVRLLGQVVDADRQRPPFEIVGLEARHSAGIGALRLNLRIDRIDELASGKKLIIDYKTGKAFSIDKWRGERPAEPQLPLYAVTGDADAIALLKIDDKVTLAGVGDKEIAIDGMIAPDSFGGDEWREVVAEWGYWLEKLVAEFMAGDVRIDAHNDADANGEFAMLTRVHSHARKNA